MCTDMSRQVPVLWHQQWRFGVSESRSGAESTFMSLAATTRPWIFPVQKQWPYRPSCKWKRYRAFQVLSKYIASPPPRLYALNASNAQGSRLFKSPMRAGNDPQPRTSPPFVQGQSKMPIELPSTVNGASQSVFRPLSTVPPLRLICDASWRTHPLVDGKVSASSLTFTPLQESPGSLSSSLLVSSSSIKSVGACACASERPISPLGFLGVLGRLANAPRSQVST